MVNLISHTEKKYTFGFSKGQCDNNRKRRRIDNLLSARQCDFPTHSHCVRLTATLQVGYVSRAVAHGLAITPNSAKKRAANGPCGSTLACIPGNGTNDSPFRSSLNKIFAGGSSLSRLGGYTTE